MLAGFAAVRANVHHDMGAHRPSALIKTGDESGHQTSTRKLMPPIMLLVTEVEISLLFDFFAVFHYNSFGVSRAFGSSCSHISSNKSVSF